MQCGNAGIGGSVRDRSATSPPRMARASATEKISFREDFVNQEPLSKLNLTVSRAGVTPRRTRATPAAPHHFRDHIVSFTVTAGAAPLVYSWQHGSMLSALEQSLSLATTGLAEVRITDGEGRAYSPAALYQVLFGQKTAARDTTAAPHARAA